MSPRILNLQNSEFVFREGDTAQFAYVLKSGTIEVLRMGSNGEIILGTVSEGEVFGEMALIDGAPRSASARALGECQVQEVDRDAFSEYISDNPSVMYALMKKLSGYVRNTNQKAIQLTKSDTEETSDSSQTQTQTQEDVLDLDLPTLRIPSQGVLVATLSILVMLIGCVVFMSLTVIDTTVGSRGIVTTVVPNAQIQAATSAIVREVLVHRGQKLKKGDLIARLDDTEVLSSLTINQSRQNTLKNRILRLEEEIRFSENSSKTNLDLSHMDSLEAVILNSRLSEFQAKSDSFATQFQEVRITLETAMEELKLAETQLALKQELEDSATVLMEQNITSRSSQIGSSDDRLSMQRQVNSLKNRIVQLQARESAIKSELAAWGATRIAGLTQDLASSNQALLELQQDEARLLEQKSRSLITSSVNGTVLNIPQFTEGSVISQGQTLVTLLRDDIPLAMEIDIQPKDVSNIVIGTKVSVKLDAIPFQKYGDITATLTYLSEDTISTDIHGAHHPVYRGRVEFPQDISQKLPAGYQLTPGMQGSADILGKKQRLVFYFLEPVIKGISKAFSEPI